MLEPEKKQNQTDIDEKKLLYGWYYEHGVPADLPHLQTILTTPRHDNIYEAAISSLSIEASHGLDLDQLAVHILQKTDQLIIQHNPDTIPNLPLFLRAIYMASPDPTELSNTVLDQFPIQSTGRMPYEVLNYVIRSKKPFEGECAQYLYDFGAHGLLEELAYAWQIQNGVYDAIDPVLRQAAAIHYKNSINTHWTDELRSLVSIAIGEGQDLPPFLQELADNSPDLCLVIPGKKSKGTYFYGNDGVEMTLPINPFSHIVQNGIEGYPPLLQPVVRKAVAEQVEANTFGYIIQDVIDTSEEEGVVVHPDIWDLVHLADAQILFRYFATDKAIPNIIPRSILQKAYDAPLDLRSYFMDLDAYSRTKTRRSIYQLQVLLNIDPETQPKRIDHQLIQYVSDEREPRPIARFLEILCQDVDRYIVQTPEGICATPTGIEAYIAVFERNDLKDPKPLQESGLLPPLTPIQEFAILHPSGMGISILNNLGVISKQGEQQSQLIYDVDKYQRYFTGTFPRYDITVAGLREWHSQKNHLARLFKYNILSNNTISQLDPFDEQELEILLAINTSVSQKTISKKLFQATSQASQLRLSDIQSVANFVHTWIFRRQNKDKTAETIRAFIEDPALIFGQIAGEQLPQNIASLQSNPDAFQKLQDLFETNDISTVLRYNYTPSQLNQIAALPYAENGAIKMCRQAVAREIVGDPQYQGASEWVKTLQLLSQRIFGSQNDIGSLGKLTKYLMEIYPISSFRSGTKPPRMTSSYRWGFARTASEEVLRERAFKRVEWMKLLGKKRFDTFLSVLPHVVTFDNSPLQRNAFTRNEYDQVTPFLNYLADRCNFSLSPSEFDRMTLFVDRYGLSQNEVLYRAFCFVLDKKPDEVSDEFVGIETLEDIDDILHRLRERIASPQPMLTLPEDLFEQALFAHEIGYSTHTYGKPPSFQDFNRQFAEPGNTGEIPNGHRAFEIAVPILSQVSEIQSDAVPALVPFVREIASLRSDGPEPWTIREPQKQLDLLFDSLIDRMQHVIGVPEHIRIYRLTKLKTLSQDTKAAQTPDDIIRILSSTSFERTDLSIVASIYRQSAILQFLRKNNYTGYIPDPSSTLGPKGIEGLYNLCVNGALNHTLAIQEFEDRQAVVITKDWDPDISSKVSIIGRMRESFMPLARILTTAMIEQESHASLVGTEKIQVIPDRGVVGELSAYIGGACYSQVFPLLAQYPGMVPYKIIHHTSVGPQIIGSFLTFPVLLKSNQGAVLVRALNIPHRSELYMPSIVKGIFNRMGAISENGNPVLIPGIDGAQSEYANILRAYKKYLEPQNVVTLATKFDFNGYDLTDNCYLVNPS